MKLSSHTIFCNRDGSITLDPAENGHPLTEAAYRHIVSENITRIFEMGEEFDSVKVDGKSALALVDEHPPLFGAQYIHGTAFLFRVELFARNLRPIIDRDYDSFDDAYSLVAERMGLVSPDVVRTMDAVVLFWMSRTRPIWHVDEITPEAATLIARARLDDDILAAQQERMDKGILIKAKDGHYLYDAISEILIVDGIGFVACRIGNNNVAVFLAEEKDLVFAATYLALMECENRPIVMRDPVADRAARKGMKMTGGIARRMISLSSRYSYRHLNRHEKVFQSKEGKVRTIVSVSGFVRNQAYGPKHSMRRLIWVDGFTRGQWVNEGLTVVTVKE